MIQSKNGYLLDCDNEFTKEIINYLLKYKLRSKIEITDVSTDYIIGLISSEKFLDIQKSEGKTDDTIEFRDSPLFLDPRNKNLGARILSSLEKLHLTIKKLDLKIVKPDIYFAKAHSLGIPVKGVENLKDQLFGLEANFEELKAIDFKLLKRVLHFTHPYRKVLFLSMFFSVLLSFLSPIRPFLINYAVDHYIIIPNPSQL